METKLLNQFHSNFTYVVSKNQLKLVWKIACYYVLKVGTSTDYFNNSWNCTSGIQRVPSIICDNGWIWNPSLPNWVDKASFRVDKRTRKQSIICRPGFKGNIFLNHLFLDRPSSHRVTCTYTIISVVVYLSYKTAHWVCKTEQKKTFTKR